MLSQGLTYGVLVSHFWHIVILFFLDGFPKVGSSKVKGKPSRNDVEENTRSFQDANIFLK
jgi:hypothetical protein